MDLGKSGNKTEASGHLPALFCIECDRSSVKLAGCHLYFPLCTCLSGTHQRMTQCTTACVKLLICVALLSNASFIGMHPLGINSAMRSFPDTVRCLFSFWLKGIVRENKRTKYIHVLTICTVMH